MTIKSLYRDYFQKSLMFLYPHLGIRRGGSVTPIRTHLSWEGQYRPEDKRLICKYHIRDDTDYVTFEKSMLTGHRLFERFEFLKEEGNTGVYVFNFEHMAEDWDKVLKGQYSMLSPDLKQKIGNFYGKNSTSYAYVNSFLHPENYYGIYAELLAVDIKLLKQTRELCPHPDFEKENLVAEIRDLHMSNASRNFIG